MRQRERKIIKRKITQIMAKGGTFNYAIQQCHVGRSTVQRWLKKDFDFADAMHTAKISSWQITEDLAQNNLNKKLKNESWCATKYVLDRSAFIKQRQKNSPEFELVMREDKLAREDMKKILDEFTEEEMDKFCYDQILQDILFKLHTGTDLDREEDQFLVEHYRKIKEKKSDTKNQELLDFSEKKKRKK